MAKWASPRTYVGIHVHKHGTSTYLFQSVDSMTMQDFINYLDDDYEPDLDSEWIEFSEETPIQWRKSNDNR